MNTGAKVGIGAATLGVLAVGAIAYDEHAKEKCEAQGGTWKGIFGGGCVSGGGTAVRTLSTPSNFQITFPSTVTSSTVQGTASWIAVSGMLSGDYYSLVITANGNQVINQQLPAGTTSYPFSAPSGASVSGSLAACTSS